LRCGCIEADALGDLISEVVRAIKGLVRAAARASIPISG
jgi:hypothetical protein